MKKHGFTYLELLVAGAIASVLFVMLIVLTLHSQQSFALMTSYSDLDSSSRNTLDLISRELHEATAVTAAGTNSHEKWLTVTNVTEATSTTLTWDSVERTLVLTNTRDAGRTLLRNCDRWDYELYNAAPNVSPAGVSLNRAISLADCRLVQMSWSCSRLIGGKMMTTSAESVRIGLRNQAR
jgi:type II secretory pathway pseudopilin PulG